MRSRVSFAPRVSDKFIHDLKEHVDHRQHHHHKKHSALDLHGIEDDDDRHSNVSSASGSSNVSDVPVCPSRLSRGRKTLEIDDLDQQNHHLETECHSLLARLRQAHQAESVIEHRCSKLEHKIEDVMHVSHSQTSSTAMDDSLGAKRGSTLQDGRRESRHGTANEGGAGKAEVEVMTSEMRELRTELQEAYDEMDEYCLKAEEAADAAEASQGDIVLLEQEVDILYAQVADAQHGNEKESEQAQWANSELAELRQEMLNRHKHAVVRADSDGGDDDGGHGFGMNRMRSMGYGRLKSTKAGKDQARAPPPPPNPDRVEEVEKERDKEAWEAGCARAEVEASKRELEALEAVVAQLRDEAKQNAPHVLKAKAEEAHGLARQEERALASLQEEAQAEVANLRRQLEDRQEELIQLEAKAEQKTGSVLEQQKVLETAWQEAQTEVAHLRRQLETGQQQGGLLSTEAPSEAEELRTATQRLREELEHSEKSNAALQKTHDEELAELHSALLRRHVETTTESTTDGRHSALSSDLHSDSHSCGDDSILCRSPRLLDEEQTAAGGKHLTVPNGEVGGALIRRQTLSHSKRLDARRKALSRQKPAEFNFVAPEVRIAELKHEIARAERQILKLEGPEATKDVGWDDIKATLNWAGARAMEGVDELVHKVQEEAAASNAEEEGAAGQPASDQQGEGKSESQEGEPRASARASTSARASAFFTSVIDGLVPAAPAAEAGGQCLTLETPDSSSHRRQLRDRQKKRQVDANSVVNSHRDI
eukprot:TRINITY_DN44947_c0_g1_i2.p1 TRINITY_DN44947_c0_g1~~TRINITY_DN44947_c0_g1_i2.p1  ORF type:complete len:768 (-),score=231.93 TRINITY_DN44947_c0_g1_i2:65-2368(-)